MSDRSPCLSCERANEDKEECCQHCERLDAYLLAHGLIDVPTRDAVSPKTPNGGRQTETPFGMYSQNGKLEKMIELLEGGTKIRETARIVGVSKVTVGKLYQRLNEQRKASGIGELLCKCGRPLKEDSK